MASKHPSKNASKADRIFKRIPWRRMAAGLGLAPILPIGWLLLRWFAWDSHPANEFNQSWMLYTYLFAVACPAFMIFGYVLGNAEARALTDRQDVLRHSRTDLLTGLLNTGGFSEALAQHTAFTHRQHAQLSMIRVSLDQSGGIAKLTTKEHRLLYRALAGVLRHGRRKEDVIGRIGGGDFAILTPGANHDGALFVASRILAGVRALEFSVGGKRLPLTVSAGVTSLLGKEPATLFVSRADRALVSARRTGGNRVVGEDASHGERSEAQRRARAAREELVAGANADRRKGIVQENVDGEAIDATDAAALSGEPMDEDVLTRLFDDTSTTASGLEATDSQISAGTGDESVYVDLDEDDDFSKS